MAGVLVFSLTVISFLTLHSSVQSSSEIPQQADEYTVWPRDNATSLSEGFPWPLCVKVTGENCPGLMDWLEHLCTRDVGQTCDVGNGSRSDRSVVLKLRPGVHVLSAYAIRQEKIGQYKIERVLDPAKFWFCNFSSLTIKGDSVSKPLLLAADEQESHQPVATVKSEKRQQKCDETIDWLSSDTWRAALAFRGGGRLLLENLRIQSNFWSYGSKMVPQYFLAVWNVQSYEVIRCTFHLGFGHGAIASIHSNDVASFKAIVRHCDINITLDETDQKVHRGVPAVIALSSSKTTTYFHPKANISCTSAPRKLTIEGCEFLVNYPVRLSTRWVCKNVAHGIMYCVTVQ